MVSRIAKNPVVISDGVTVNILDNLISIKGKNGELSLKCHPTVKVVHEDNELRVAASDEHTAMAGTMRALLQNMVTGVTNGFEAKLKLVGVGYRAKAQGKCIDLSLGKSHPVKIDMPEGVTVETPEQTVIILRGADKQKVFQVAANIRAERPPEPYKGKGIRFENEIVRRKEAKKK